MSLAPTSMTLEELINEMHAKGKDYRRGVLSCGCRFHITLTDEKTGHRLTDLTIKLLEQTTKKDH